jgi:hypothetical protein
LRAPATIDIAMEFTARSVAHENTQVAPHVRHAKTVRQRQE